MSSAFTPYTGGTSFILPCLFNQILDRCEIHPLGAIDHDVFLIFPSPRERRHQLGRKVLSERTDPQLIGVGLQEGGLPLWG